MADADHGLPLCGADPRGRGSVDAAELRGTKATPYANAHLRVLSARLSAARDRARSGMRVALSPPLAERPQ